MKKIIVNQEACIGCGACVAIDSEHFAFNDEGLSHAISQENQDSSALLEAVNACPTSAISISEVEKETDEETSNCAKEDNDCSSCENCQHCKEE